MKKIWLTIVICGWAFMGNAQTIKSGKLSRDTTASVEKSIFSIQTGYLGIWVNNEARLSNSFVLKSEIGLAAGIWVVSLEKVDFLLTPQVTLEPRWYYNLKKRKSKSKSIAGNSGNFLGLQTGFLPGGWVISNTDVNQRPVLSLFLVWGIQRQVGRHFNYALGTGPVYAHVFSDKKENSGSDNYNVGFLIRIGYRF
jgi:hypothetical protein